MNNLPNMQQERIAKLGALAEQALVINAMLYGCLNDDGTSVPPADRGCVAYDDAVSEAFRIAQDAAQ